MRADVARPLATLALFMALFPGEATLGSESGAGGPPIVQDVRHRHPTDRTMHAYAEGLAALTSRLIRVGQPDEVNGLLQQFHSVTGCTAGASEPTGHGRLGLIRKLQASPVVEAIGSSGRVVVAVSCLDTEPVRGPVQEEFEARRTGGLQTMSGTIAGSARWDH